VSEETLFYFLKKAEGLGPLTASDKKELKTVLENKSVQRLLVLMNQEADERLTQATGWNLSTPQGVAEAQNSQGHVRGLKRALDIIWDNSRSEEQ